MQINAHAKLNWFLQVTGKRLDGFHELLMVNQRLDLCDKLTLLPASDLSLSISGNSGLSSGSDNLIWRAAQALSEVGGRRLGAQIHLEKRIPAGAGLGGGSADAAAALLALNSLWGLHYGMEQLAGIGASLGADIPYCLFDGPAIVRGMGELVEPLPPLPPYWLILLKPTKSLSTARVFDQYSRCGVVGDRMNLPRALQALRTGDWQVFTLNGANALQESAVALLGDISELISLLYQNGAKLAQMTGSGSCVYGVFASEVEARRGADHLQGKAAYVGAHRTI